MKQSASTLGAAGVLVTAAVSAATAQEALVLDRLVVTAGQEKIAIETPQSVSVVDQEDLDAAQPTTVGDALTDLPGVKAIGSDRVLGESFNIRGIGTLGSSDENRLIVQVDGVTKFYEQYRVGSFFSDPELYKRIEVLRGPASSTLYGAGALAGVISLTTKDAADFLAEGDSFAFREKLGFDSNRNGFLTSTVGAWQPTEGLDLLGSFIYRRSSEFEDGAGNRITGSDFAAPSGLLKGSYRFGDGNAHQIRGSYQHWTTEQNDQDYSQTGTQGFGTVDREVTDQTAMAGYRFNPADNDLIDLDVGLGYTYTEVDQTNASLQGAFGGSSLFEDTEYSYEIIQGRAQNTLTHAGANYENFLTAGIQASHQTRTADSMPTVSNPTGGISFHPGGKSINVGVFVQDELVYREKLTVIPGVRVDWQKLEPDNQVTVTDDSVTNVAVSPKLAAHYQLNENWGVFGSVSYTERLPVIDEAFDANSSNLNLDPEKSINYEAGVAVSFRDIARAGDGAQVKATVFFNQIDDLIERLNTSSTFQNVGEAEIYGVELEGAYDADVFFSRLAATAIRGEDTDTGDPLNSIPADEVVLTLGGRVPSLDLEFGWRGVFAAEQDEVSGSTSETDGYVVHDLFANWQPRALENASIRLSIDNLFDKQYREHLAGDPAKGLTFKITLTAQL